MAKALFFDVDGVLLDSVPAKGEAFVVAFRDFPEKADLIRRFHRTHGGVPRAEKIALIRQRICGLPPDRQDENERVKTFSEVVKDFVFASPAIPGAARALESLTQDYALHAVSATPTSELEEVLRYRGWTELFRSIHGGPASKAEILQCLIRRHDYVTQACFMIGDSSQDRLAALANNVPFILVEGSIDAQEGDFTAVPNLESLPTIVRSIGRLPS